MTGTPQPGQAAGAAPQGGAPGGNGDPASGAVTAPWAGAEGVWNLGEGQAAKPWYEAVPEPSARELMKTKNYANPAELALAYTNLSRLQSGASDVIALPGADATPEQMNAFYSKLGRPESADKYDLKPAEGVQMDEGLLKLGKEIFYEVGATPKAAQAAMDKWNKAVGEMNAAAVQRDTEANAAAVQKLEAKWGPSLQENKQAGLNAIKALGLSNDIVDAVDSHIGTAAIIEMLATIGSKMKEGNGLIGGNNGGNDPNNPDTMTKEQAQARIKQLEGDKDFQAKYTDAKHPEYKQALHIMERLFAKAG